MRVDNDGVGIDYEVAGDGPPVILLHGFPDTRRLWRHQVPALVDAGYRACSRRCGVSRARDRPGSCWSSSTFARHSTSPTAST